MSKLFDELASLKEAYDKKLEEAGEDAVKEVFKEFFDKYPRAESITWVQYTPYFNDGDACYFSVGEMRLSLSEPEDGEEDEGEEDDDEWYDDWDSYGLAHSEDPELKAIGEDFGTLEDTVPEDVMEKVFGDHVRITATREGFEVREFDHD